MNRMTFKPLVPLWLAASFSVVPILCGADPRSEANRSQALLEKLDTKDRRDEWVLKQYLSLEPDDVGGTIALADLLAADARPAEAIQMLVAALALRHDPHLLLRLAHLEQSPNKREQLARQALTVDAWNPRGHLELAVALRLQGKADEAQTALDDYFKLEVINPRGWYEAAMVSLLRGQRRSAIVNIERAMYLELRGDVDLPPVYWRTLAAVYREDPRWKSAVDQMESRAGEAKGPMVSGPLTEVRFGPLVRGDELPPPILSRPYLGGYCGGSFGRTSASGPPRLQHVYRNSIAAALDLRAGDEIVSVNGQSIGSFEQLLEVLYAIEPQPGAEISISARRGQEEIVLNGLIRTKDDSFGATRAVLRRAGEHYRAGRSADAERAYAAVIETNLDTNSEALDRLPLLAIRSGNAQGAITFLDTWLKLNPRCAKLWYQKAQALVDRDTAEPIKPNWLSEALKCAERAVAFQPENAAYQAYLGLLESYSQDPKRRAGVSERFTRAVCLGCGGSGVQVLAKHLDGQRARAAAQKATRETEKTAKTVLSILSALSGRTVSGSRSRYGSNPYVDYGYQARDMYGVDHANSQTILAPIMPHP